MRIDDSVSVIVHVAKEFCKTKDDNGLENHSGKEIEEIYRSRLSGESISDSSHPTQP